MRSGNPMEPLLWGWEKSDQSLIPVTTLKGPAPETLLKTISCKCALGCKGGCSCRKAGSKCFTICKYCKGQSCMNAPLEDEIDTYTTELEDDVDLQLQQFDSDEDDVDYLPEDEENTSSSSPSFSGFSSSSSALSSPKREKLNR